MKMIENYISNVKHYLPDDMKEDITEELANSLYEQIEDKQQALGRKLDQQEQVSCLKAWAIPCGSLPPIYRIRSLSVRITFRRINAH